MAIRKDVNDMLNNLKQEEPPKEEKHVKSKFDNMSVDDLMNALNGGKEPPRKAPIRELKRIPPSKKNDYSKPENNNPPKKKKIVIGELPDYDAIEQQEIEKEIKKKNPIAENKKKDTVKENKDSEKKGFFARVKDLMYASADDEEETEEEKETSDDDDTNGNFTVEEIKESSEIAIASIEEAISAINDNELVKDEEKTVSENEDKPKENKSEPVSKNKKKNNNKSKQNNSQKTKNSNSESETKPEKSEENKAETEKPEEKKSESQIEKEEEKPETKTENTVDSEEKKEPPKNTSQSGSGNKKKKNRNKQKKDNQKPVKSSDSIIEDIQKDAEKAISEIENSDSSKNEKQEDSDVDTVVEETKNDLPDKEYEQTENVSEEQEENNSEEPTENTDDDEIIVRISETPVKSSEKYKKSRYAIPALLCIVLAIIGVIAIVSTLISNIGGKDDFEKAVYPAVIMNIEPFDSPSELTSDQIISATIWSVVIDDEKLSKYNEIMGAVNIPASDVEEYAVELFGEDIPELNHTTVGAAESRFYYNKDAQSYNVPIKPDTFTYIPEVTSVSKKSGEYVVNVNYIEEHPEWMEKSVVKEVQFRLSKNDNGGYKIDSMEVFSESSST
ncbi:MAG: hypothetical protein J6B74_08370 [Ruminococcus sp.]|nr:hypothetical protein [Ruminococcus sp.]